MTYEEKVNEAVAFLQGAGMQEAQVGIVLGTGLGKLVEEIDIEVEIAYDDIPHFPIATVEFHSGRLIYGQLAGKRVLAMSGRFHYYEGYTAKDITFPIRVLKLLGIEQLLLSNAAGAMNMDYRKGDLMLIEDHINLLPDNPLFGKNVDAWGGRFPDMSAPYDKRINKLLHQAAEANDITLHEGVYVAVGGPNLETRAEYRFLSRIGADVVGMSTVPEVIVCAHMGLPCAAISVLTDECDPDNLKPVDIEEIIAVAGQAETKLIRVFLHAIERL
ncbi:purine-nucleoside phosphorylase [Cryomorphaceae bacterium]|nr:purine-nucleoside phosphorylase [Cryomorphaceae bacterium]